MSHGPQERWVWVDLPAFDVEAPDLAVDAWLSPLGFIPDVVALFLFNPEVVLGHPGAVDPAWAERVLPPDCCAYHAHPYGYNRPRQVWTAGRLRDLCGALRDRGVAPFLSLMELFGEGGPISTTAWTTAHPEVWVTHRNIGPYRSVCHDKRLADGTWYEDYFADRLRQALLDFGFAGFHQADGVSHPRLALWIGDHSDDLIAQFAEHSGEALPGALGQPCGGNLEVVRARADWIWTHRRRAWIDFYADRTTRFCRKVADAVHAAGGRVVLNGADTRDPFEILYRYGTDVRRLAEFVDGFIAETVAPGCSVGAGSGHDTAAEYNYHAMLLLLKASARERPVLCLNGVRDVAEQWDVLRHAPALMEREATTQASRFCWTATGQLERCCHGPMVCLGDGIRPHEWAWLREWWDRAHAPELRPRTVTLVWSDAALDAALDDYLATQRYTTHKLLQELLRHGAPVHAVVRAEHVAALPPEAKPLLVLNPRHFPPADLAAVLDREDLPRYLLGALPDELQPTAGELHCWPLPASDAAVVAPPQGEPVNFYQEIAFQPVDETWLAERAAALAAAVMPARVVREAESCRLHAFDRDDGLRLLVCNDGPRYLVAGIELDFPIAQARIVGEFPITPPAVTGSSFTVRVPSRGMVVVEVTRAASA